MNGQTGVVSSTDQPNAIVDTEIYDGLGKKVRQFYSNANLKANTESTCTWAGFAPDSGDYTVKVGVFSSDWTLLNWNNNAASYHTNYGHNANPTNQYHPPAQGCN